MSQILIVDDNRVWTDVLREHCEIRGYAAETTSTYESAIEKLAQSTFYVAIVDLRLSSADPSDTRGMDLIRAISKSELEVPNCIVVTGYPTVERSREAFKELRVWDFISKLDLDFDAFFEIIEQAVEDAVNKIHPRVKQLKVVWEQIVKGLGEVSSTGFNKYMWELTGIISQALGLSPGSDPGSMAVRNQVYCFSLDTSDLFTEARALQRIPLMFLNQQDIISSDFGDMVYFMNKQTPYTTSVAILVLFSGDEHILENRFRIDKIMRQTYARDVAVLGNADLVRLLVAKDPRRAFKRLLLSQIDLSAVSPFTITGPTPDTMFFGRERELRQVVERAAMVSWVAIGGRRIGKSSFLGSLHRVRLPAAGFYTIYHDCSITPTYDVFTTATIHDWRPEPPPGAPATFGDLFQSPPDDKPLVLLLDEADRLIPTDRTIGWPLFNALRALTNSGRAQVVLSGERTLRDALRDPKSPLFNFANEMLLGPLDYRAVEELVTRPMKQLEIELVDEKAIVDRIWALTSGHPNVVQRLCRRLMERLNEQGTRHITLDDVDAVTNDPKFQEEDFLNTYLERATPLEQIISLLMAQGSRPWRLQAVLDLLAAQDLQPEPEVVKAALDRLVDLRSILKRSQAGYEFAVEAFPLVTANTTTVEDLLIVLKSQYLKNPMELVE